ncbi:hypothetical protein CEXT_88981 [Caerostris extrusa]|uniref:Uncharacterized protein n=1 Tax=Caerostris extrusa TaxID=172846 RepID=A0AAV4V548_CAEEX|nr:hypothetical protein CEXT_88981 [Caerostris extrusa]
MYQSMHGCRGRWKFLFKFQFWIKKNVRSLPLMALQKSEKNRFSNLQEELLIEPIMKIIQLEDILEKQESFERARLQITKHTSLLQCYT